MQKSSKKKASPKPRKTIASTPEADAERHRRVAALAYAIGARRGFEGGIDQARDDWLEAERTVDLEVAR